MKAENIAKSSEPDKALKIELPDSATKEVNIYFSPSYF